MLLRNPVYTEFKVVLNKVPKYEYGLYIRMILLGPCSYVINKVPGSICSVYAHVKTEPKRTGVGIIRLVVHVVHHQVLVRLYSLYHEQLA